MKTQIILFLSLLFFTVLGSTKVEFPVITHQFLGKQPCSPDLAAKEGITFNMPNEIVWGDALPICGLLKVADKLGIKQPGFKFFLKPKDKVKNLNLSSHELGEPNLNFDTKANELLTSNQELYFNINGQHSSRSLPPGEYKVSLSYRNNTYQSAEKSLKVKAIGWRKNFSNTLMNSICNHRLINDLKDYLSLINSHSNEDLNTAERIRMDRTMRNSWNQGFAKHRVMITKKVKSKLMTMSHSDRTIPYYTQKQIEKTSCTNQSNFATLVNIFEGIRSFE